jgi:hypothetical protein
VPNARELICLFRIQLRERPDIGFLDHVLGLKAGMIDYYCRFHPNMKATLAVAP